ncbi:transposable element Tcb2 transposase [Trichonephila clavipes]|nr:transposable element Tcb2 transposase [Trichonephila clavipes]
MASLGNQSLPLTDLGRADEEMASPGGRLSQWRPTTFSQKALKIEMTELCLIQHVVSHLEPQVQDYVEVRNPTTRAQLLLVISKFDERYSARETQGSSKNYNRERRDWHKLQRSPDDRRNRNGRDAEVLDRQNDRRDNYRSTYGNRLQKKVSRQEVTGCKRRIPSSRSQVRASPFNLRPRSKVTKEAGSRPSGRAVQAQGRPTLSKREPFRRPSPYNQSRNSRQLSKQQGRQQPEQSQRNGRSSHHLPGQSRHSRHQDCQEPNGNPASRRFPMASLGHQSLPPTDLGRVDEEMASAVFDSNLPPSWIGYQNIFGTPWTGLWAVYGGRSSRVAMVANSWPELSSRGVADAVGVARSVVARLWNRFQETGNVRCRPGAGRPRATTSTDDRYIQLTARRNRTENATQLQRQLLLATGRRVSSQTARNRLHEGGLYARRPMVCIPLTPHHRAARRRWAAEHRDWEQHDWSQVLFTDESQFSLESDTRRVLVWRDRGTRNNPAFVRERSQYRRAGWMVRGGISIGGPIGDSFVFQDDNARPHRARLVENMLEAETIQRMEWPACSPDLNPIEHVWDMLGRRIAARPRPPATVRDLEIALLEEWNIIPQSLIDNLIASMANRCAAVLAV